MIDDLIWFPLIPNNQNMFGMDWNHQMERYSLFCSFHWPQGLQEFADGVARWDASSCWCLLFHGWSWRLRRLCFMFLYTLFVEWLRPFAIRKPFGVFLSTIRQPSFGIRRTIPGEVRNQLARDDRNDSSSRALQDFWSGQRALDRSNFFDPWRCWRQNLNTFSACLGGKKTCHSCTVQPPNKIQ